MTGDRRSRPCGGGARCAAPTAPSAPLPSTSSSSAVTSSPTTSWPAWRTSRSTPGTKGPACAVDGRTTAPGVFATGNLVHPAETADVAARRALSVGRAAAAWLRDGDGHPVDPAAVPLRVADPLLWVVPNLAEPGRAVTGPLLVRTRTFLDHPRPRGDPGRPAPRLVPPPPPDPEPVACAAVGLAAARAARRGRGALRLVRCPGREKWHPAGCHSFADRPASAGRTAVRLRTSRPGSWPSGRRTRPRSGCPGPSGWPVP